jgi:hypothetical protein
VARLAGQPRDAGRAVHAARRGPRWSKADNKAWKDYEKADRKAWREEDKAWRKSDDRSPVAAPPQASRAMFERARDAPTIAGRKPRRGAVPAAVSG